jgi:hypothetical protein
MLFGAFILRKLLGLLLFPSFNILVEVCIRNVPENVVAIKTDSFPDLRHFFHCSSNVGQCKRADFVTQ